MQRIYKHRLQYSQASKLLPPSPHIEWLLWLVTVEEHSRLLFQHLSCVRDTSSACVDAGVSVAYPSDVQTNTASIEPLRVHSTDNQSPWSLRFISVNTVNRLFSCKTSQSLNQTVVGRWAAWSWLRDELSLHVMKWLSCVLCFSCRHSLSSRWSTVSSLPYSSPRGMGHGRLVLGLSLLWEGSMYGYYWALRLFIVCWLHCGRVADSLMMCAVAHSEPPARTTDGRPNVDWRLYYM